MLLMTEEERKKAYAACTRFLPGHAPVSVKARLSELASAVESDEAPDVYGAGTLIENFEKEVAALLGKEAAVFMPSGTMAQPIALRIWCERAGVAKIGLHPTSHLELHEQKAYQELHGLEAETLGSEATQLSVSDFEKSSASFAVALCELPQRESGGTLPSWHELVAMSEFCRSRGIKFHLDGARLWEAQPYYARPLAEICALFDSVYVSFYKGLGGITGAILAGPTDFIAEAKIWQRRQGGNLYRLYPYVISAREALKTRLPKMAAYYEKARELALVLAAFPDISVIPKIPQTNMMHLHFNRPAEEMAEGFARVAAEDKVALLYYFVPVGETKCKTEISIGDAAFDLDLDLVKQLFAKALN